MDMTRETECVAACSRWPPGLARARFTSAANVKDKSLGHVVTVDLQRMIVLTCFTRPSEAL